jgi:hypothetical protein
MFIASLLVIGIVSRTIYTYAAAPINGARPAILGIARVGEILTLDDGIWDGGPTFTYQWRSCDSGGLNCSDIGGATNNSYTLQGTDIGTTVIAVVTGTNVDGSASASTNPSSVVQASLGDINGDGAVNLFDLGKLLGQWQSGSAIAEDLDGSGQVNQTDLNLLLGLYQP